MATRVKIKISDNKELRKQIDLIYESASQEVAARWAVSIAKHIFDCVGLDYQKIGDVIEGFQINELWQEGNVSMHEIRKSGYKVHKLAREEENIIKKTALRVAGQAIAGGHMKEHAMVASDYAVKTIGLLYQDDMTAITREREWQLHELKIILQIKDEKYE